MTQAREEKLKRHPANDGRFQCTAQKNVIGDRADIGDSKQIVDFDGQAVLVGRAVRARGDDRILQQKWFDALAVQPERDCFLEMLYRGGAFVQRVIGSRDVVVASRVQMVHRNRFGQRLGREPMIAGRLLHHAENIQRLGMCGSPHQDLFASDLGIGDPSLLVGERGFSHQRRNVGWRGNRGSLAARQGGAAISSVHRWITF